MNAEIRRVCQCKAYAANRPRRCQHTDGEWATVQPSPKITWETVYDVLCCSHGHCHWCGECVGLNGWLEHLIRVADGGTNERSNLVWSCKRCNLRGYYRETDLAALLNDILLECYTDLFIDAEMELYSANAIFDQRVTLRRLWRVPSKFEGVIMLADDKLVKLYGKAARDALTFELPVVKVLRIGSDGSHYWEEC